MRFPLSLTTDMAGYMIRKKLRREKRFPLVLMVERKGVFRAAVEGIKAAKEAGFLVCTNTTVFKDTDMAEIYALYGYLTELGVDGFMLSPAYGYAAVCSTNPDGAAEIFLTREQIKQKFNEAAALCQTYTLNTS